MCHAPEAWRKAIFDRQRSCRVAPPSHSLPFVTLQRYNVAKLSFGERYNVATVQPEPMRPDTIYSELSEAELMNLCKEALGEDSYAEWAGFWRICIRGNAQNPAKPGKVQRVMNAVIQTKREGRIKIRDLGAFAYDLFTKRFAD